MFNSADVIEIIDAFETSGISIWIYGGWGVDALLERQTRPHDDLDVLILEDDIDLAMSTSRYLGFSLITDELPQGFVMRDANDRRIDFHPICIQENGIGIQKIRDGGKWIFSADGLQGTGKINGRTVRCLTPEEEAVRASDQPECAGYEPDDQDRRDMQLLKERFGINLPYPFDNI